MSKRVRIDLILVQRSCFSSRTDARKAILAGYVKAGTQRVLKPSETYDPDVPVTVEARKKYVSRGGDKLEAALRHFNLTVGNCVCLDIGSSTGGFTDCLLRHGARRVYAVDVGYGQIHEALRKDSRVVVMERTHARTLSPERFPEPVDRVTIDVSFISLDKILPVIPPLLGENGAVLALVKPQFEAGRGRVGKGGVVRDQAVRDETIQKVRFAAEELGLMPRGVFQSPLKGPAGNVEYFLLLTK